MRKKKQPRYGLARIETFLLWVAKNLNMGPTIVVNVVANVVTF
jgi:hypothetical protein